MANSDISNKGHFAKAVEDLNFPPLPELLGKIILFTPINRKSSDGYPEVLATIVSGNAYGHTVRLFISQPQYLDFDVAGLVLDTSTVTDECYPAKLETTHPKNYMLVGNVLVPETRFNPGVNVEFPGTFVFV